MTPVDPATLPNLPTVIGSDRLGPYLASTGDLSAALRLYSWNIEASAAILGASSALDVGVRNAMHRALTAHWGRDSWWDVAPLRANEGDQVRDAIRFLDRRRGAGQWSAGHVVAELRASFWEGLLVNRYHRALWEPALARAFPSFTGRRGDLHARLERLRLLRNRAAHHEPVHARDLMVDHRYLCELAQCIDDDLAAWIRSHSRLPDIVAARADTVAGRRPTRF
ncbi:hypothetical protein EDF54_0300 [Rathayibacter sp. PhB93]|uniref:hypothetical protein n=1 Tax=unclassified Rathayibacter TaxID=2609250 RepID=UPI000F4A18AC|nr:MULTISPECIES: hypothetical protein [unclassified Rathayibacter]ROQ15438.1 hypothetical protein EDF54_0300 [Rathayibacter sp. PhB93]TDQ15376.1 hypothetical protein EDF17_0045 [Rathayibacter sp. PhB1]